MLVRPSMTSVNRTRSVSMLGRCGAISAGMLLKRRPGSVSRALGNEVEMVFRLKGVLEGEGDREGTVA